MIAYISGEVGRAVMIDGGSYFGLIRNVDESIPLDEARIPSFLQHSYDVEVVDCSGVSDVVERLQCHWLRDRAHRMVLMAFDTSEDPQIRAHAASIAEERLLLEECRSFSLRILYSQPMPEKVDCFEVADFLERSGFSRLLELFKDLVYHQDRIIGCSSAWSDIPSEVFSSEHEQAEFRARIVKSGAFYDFVLSEGDRKAVNNALFQILADPIVGSQAAKALAIVTKWGARYQKSEKISYDYYVKRVDTKYWRDEQPRVPGYVMFERVKKQKEAIKKELLASSYDRAQSLIDDLISDQRLDSGSEHIAKTLCDLAIFCRDLGDQGRFYGLSLRATEEAPDDAWAYIQLGNAQLSMYHFSAAMASFEKAKLYGDERSALLGKAEAMRYLGNNDDAISVLNHCLEKYPGDEVALNSRASTLAYAGRFEESLALYGEIISSPFASAHAYGGRASVFSDIGNFEQAAVDQEMAIFLAKDDPISYCAMADILREAGRFDDAMRVLSKAPGTARSRLLTAVARSRVYRDTGSFAEAIEELTKTADCFPMDASVKIASADIFRRTRRYEDALAIYNQLDHDSVQSKVARNSAAACYAAMNRYEAALACLPVRLASTKYDWIGQGIRAAILIKQGSLAQASTLIDDCLDNCPWERQRIYFASTRALLSIKLGGRSSAVAALSAVEYRESNAWVNTLKNFVGIDVGNIRNDIAGACLMPVVVDFEDIVRKVKSGRVDLEACAVDLGLEVIFAAAA